jgi:nucleotide-binding universal stress UspA family protein
MFQTILVPLDGSSFGEQALPLALGIAGQANASVRLVHVLNPISSAVPELMVYRTTLREEYHREKQIYLDNLVKRIHAVSPVTVLPEIIEGEVADTLRNTVADGLADMIVMTTHGRGPLARFWLGSVADELVRTLPVPLMLVRPSREAPELKFVPTVRRILLPLDSTPLAEQMIAPATELARTMHARCTLFRVIQTDIPASLTYPPQGTAMTEHVRFMVEQLETARKRLEHEAEQYLEKVAAGMREAGVEVEIRVAHDEKPAGAILKEAEWGYDLIAMETHGHRGLKRLWLGSVADKVIRGSHGPVLVHRPKQ